MIPNPFTPIFGGKPDSFFGRKELLRRFETAMIDRGSDYRALFITGTRGYGKTALLEQLSRRADAAGWKVLDVGSDNPVETIVRRLAGASSKTKTVNPSVGVNVFGTGVSVGGVSTSKTVQYVREDLTSVVLDACAHESRGLLLTVDEIQKVKLDDVAAICDAFQMASRKGYDAMLAVAGLPYAYASVIQHEGCTYLRRSVHELMDPLSPAEVREAFAEAFARAAGLAVEDDASELLVSASKGHPYIMQLLGYYLVEDANASGFKQAGSAHAERAIGIALDSYAQRAVEPIVQALPKAEVEYLAAMSRVIGESRVAKTADIAQTLGKTQQQTSRLRQHLIDQGIIIAAGHGEVIFGIPYLDDYLLNPRKEDDELASRIEWGY